MSMMIKLTTLPGESVIVGLVNVNYIGEINSGPHRGMCVINFGNTKEILHVRQSLAEIMDALGGMVRDLPTKQ